jgi:hypothetical protein
MATAAEIQQQIEQQQAIAKEKVPQRRFGSQVTREEQQQYIDKMETVLEEELDTDFEDVDQEDLFV